jgi:hypothetical protein
VSKLNAGLYSSADHTWQTPPDIVKAILTFEGREQFDLDAASTQSNIPAHIRYTETGLFQGMLKLSDECGLTGKWDTSWDEFPGAAHSLVWMNPPYGAKLKLFLEKAYTEAQNKNIRVWGLVPARTETLYQHRFGLTKAGFTVFLSGRLEFWRDGKPYMVLDKKTGKMKPGNAPFPTMLMYWGHDWEYKAKLWLKKKPLPGTLMLRGDELLKLF